MPKQLATDALSSRWADLPFDLLRDISRRLHVAADFVRFHAVCEPWRDTLPPPPCWPAFLPLLLAPRDEHGHRTARCVFSSSRSSRRRGAAAVEVCIRDRRWVIRAGDGAAASLLTAYPDNASVLAEPFTRSAAATPLPPWSDEIDQWADRAIGAVSGDGTVFLYAFASPDRWWNYVRTFNMALLRPGDTAWTSVQGIFGLPLHSRSNTDICSMAYHGGKIIQCHGCSWRVVSAQADGTAGDRLADGSLTDERCREFQSSYLVESRGELLWAFVRVKSEYYTHNDPNGYCFGFVSGMARALMVSVYALRVAEDGGEPMWVEKDVRSLAGRILFLGRPSSFAVDAARFGRSHGGCAYFVLRRNLFGGMWSKSELRLCRLFKYSFLDDTSELVEQLPAQWNDEACMWLTPQPAIASTEEIRERIKAMNRKATKLDPRQFGAYFRIYVGNLPRRVDSYQLRQFFSKHGNVTDARVMYDKRTGRSRGFGFVTMAIAADDEPADAIGKLHGQSLDARPLRVKFADQESGKQKLGSS
ncbi:hypothetical protein ACP70R_003802 [Stipagrostis hirtigluma subsp. patula]